MLTNQQIKRLLYLLDAKFFAGFACDDDSDSVILKIGDYQLWYRLSTNKTNIYLDGRSVTDSDRTMFVDLLLNELFYRIDNGETHLEGWIR